MQIYNKRYEGYFYKVWEGALSGKLIPYEGLTGFGRAAAEGLPVGCSRTYESTYPGECPAMLINMGRGGEHSPSLPTPPLEPAFV